MSEESDLDDFKSVVQKRKRSTRQIEDSGSSSDSPFEQRRAHKRVLRVSSDPESSSSDSDGLLQTPASRVQQVVNDGNDTSDESDLDWDDYDEEEEEEEEEDSENASEEYTSTSSDESSDCSDWESLEETEERSEEASASSLKSGAASAVDSYESKACDGAATSAVYMSDSSDGQPEKCPICLLSFTVQEIGTPKACDHSFCVDCLQEWSKNANTCPVDRQIFTLILVRRCLGGKVIRKIPVTPPRQQDEDDVQEDLTYCEPSTSSGIDFLEADSSASINSIRQRPVTNTTRTTHKRRKISRRKTAKMRSTKRKRTGTKKSKKTTSSTKSSLNRSSKRGIRKGEK